MALFILTACTSNQEQQLCYHAVPGDYTETITTDGTIKAEHTTFINAPRLFLATITWVEEDGKYVEKGDTVCILEHAETQTQLESLREDLKTTQARLERLEADHQVQLAMLQAEIENNNIQLSITSLDSIQKRFAPPLQQKLISLKQQKAAVLKEKLDKKFNARKTIGETEIRGMQFRITQSKSTIERTQEQLNELIITAPKSGILMRTEAPTMMFMMSDGFGKVGGKIEEGALTFPNMNILEIPEMERMQVLARLSESNYKKTEAGQKVTIRVEARDNLVTTGTVLRKMLTGKQQNRGSGVKFYEALIEVDSCHNQLTPGMNAVCDIVINEFQDTLVVPAVSVFKDEEQNYVYLLENKKYRKTPVTTGYTSTTYCVISGGLPPNSHIALSRPPEHRIFREKKQPGNQVPDTDTTGQQEHGNDSLIITHSSKKTRI